MEFVLLDLVLFLGHHAVDCGAEGECIIKAQQLLPQQTGPLDRPMRTRIVAPERLYPRRNETTDHPPHDSLELSGSQTRAASVTVSLDELTSRTPREAVIASYALAADILGEFGIVEPMILRPDGLLKLTNVSYPLNEMLKRWASSHNMLAVT